MNIAHIHPSSEIYGPGRRFVIWTQGCSIHCPGCWNTALWDFRPRQEITPAVLVKMALSEPSQPRGVTILGGEPFDQYADLLDLARLLQETHLSLMLYSGYRWAQLEAAGKTEVLNFTDIFVEGPYLHAQRDMHLRWRGSSNQVVHFLSDRYRDHLKEEAREIELLFHPDGSITTYGYPDPEFLHSITSAAPKTAHPPSAFPAGNVPPSAPGMC